jgi:NitT/TauT family transport system permease protein
MAEMRIHNMKKYTKIVLLLLSVAVAEVIEAAVPDSPKHQVAAHPYFSWVLFLILTVFLVRFLIGIIRKESIEKLSYKAPFLTGVVLFLNILNIVTLKMALLPVLYFPSLDRIFGTIFEDYSLILKCVGYSAKILITGVVCGTLIGFFMGVAVGFSKKVSYWLSPNIRVIGPIPSTAWIPILLVALPSARAASTFVIGLSVWFPVVVMTSSGVSNVSNSYFEVSATLGANAFWRVFRVAVPAAMPSIFQGLFNGTCGSFIALMTAEMIGAKYGIGWYVNWQKEMMAYANVYAGLIVIAVLFYLIITGLFRIRDHVLVWQKGVIKW